MNKTIAISGGFDPVHIGHLNMIEGAADHGDVIVILNSDAWLQQKKGYVFMPFEERKAILEAFSDVHHVISVDDSDGTVCMCYSYCVLFYLCTKRQKKAGHPGTTTVPGASLA